jgi:hypothetical protein
MYCKSLWPSRLWSYPDLSSDRALGHCVMHVWMAVPSWLQHRLHAAFWNDLLRCHAVGVTSAAQMQGCARLYLWFSFQSPWAVGLFARRQAPRLKGCVAARAPSAHSCWIMCGRRYTKHSGCGAPAG